MSKKPAKPKQYNPRADHALVKLNMSRQRQYRYILYATEEQAILIRQAFPEIDLRRAFQSERKLP